MISMMTLLLFLSVIVSAQTFNPVKISMMLLMASTMSFSLIYIWTSSLWFPAIMYLVFMGGILMMFMILSSILPNQKTQKNSKKLLWAAILYLSVTLMSQDKLIEVSHTSTKNLLSSSLTMFFFFFSVSAYFMVMILMIKMMKMPLRTISIC